jgi:hypothetical protein
VAYNEGDKAQGPCYACMKLVTETFAYAEYKSEGIVNPEILQGFCDECGSPVSIPYQSTYKIREFIDSHKNI